MMRRLTWLFLAFPAAIVLIGIALANRHDVRLVLDPFVPEAPAFALSLPFYVFILGTLIAGVILGGIATWFSQARYRKLARVRGSEARRWQSEAERLQRERDLSVDARLKPALAAPDRDAA